MKTSIAFLSLVLATASAPAAIVTYNSATIANTTGNQTLNLSQFDTSLGTLTDVQLTWYLAITSPGSIGIDNEAPTGGSTDYDLGIQLQKVGSSATTLNDSFSEIFLPNLAIDNSGSIFLAADDGDGAGYQAGGTDHALITLAAGSTNASGNVRSQFFDGYEGTGNWTLTLNAIQSIGVSGADKSFTGTSPDFEYYASVQYTYDPVPLGPSSVPEPGTMALFAAGFGLLQCLRRRD